MLIFLLLLVYADAWYLQGVLFINWDVSQLLHAAQLMLDGGTYSTDFFVPNPPSILWLYAFPVLVSKLLQADLVLVFRLYILLIATLSLCMCYRYAKLIFSKSNTFTKDIFIIALAVIFLVLPLHQYGQRECLLYMLTFPYLLLIATRLERKAVSTLFASLTGLLAIVGIIIKPQFIFLPLTVECYYLYRTKNWLGVFRPETILMTIVYIFYGISVIWFYPDYISDVVPYLLTNYYASLANPWHTLVFSGISIFGAIVALLIMLQHNQLPLSKSLLGVLLSALVGYYLIYFSQRTLFLYHSLPILFTSTLLLVLYLTWLARKSILSRDDYLITIGIGAVVGIIFFRASQVVVINILQPELFFAFFIFLFSFLLLARDTNKVYAFIKAFVIVLVAWLAYYYSIHTELYSYTTFISFLVLFALFRVVNKQVYVAFFATTMLMVPLLIGSFIYANALNYKGKVLTPLIAYAHKQSPIPSTYILSIMTNYTAPLMHYSDMKVVGRFDCLWMINGLVNIREKNGDNFLRSYIKKNQDRRFFINMIAEDIKRHKPQQIWVDVRPGNALPNGFAKDIDILSYFLESDLFHDSWQDYRYVSTISGPGSFKLAVYQRIKE